MLWQEAFDMGARKRDAIEAALADMVEAGDVYDVYHGAHCEGLPRDWQPTIGIEVPGDTSAQTIASIYGRVAAHRVPGLIINVFPQRKT